MPVEMSRADPATGTRTALSPDVEVTAETDGPWRTVVWNDPVNLMSYVVFVFRRYFGYSRLVAEQLMMQVHEDGRAIVSHGSRERVETDVQAMHSFGLRATLEKAGED
ncbi:ATP-dependent Clp protease adapter ClpS [Brachybacterium paraconglomeratum]|uniref:ATP-dependent Clp protease adapter ClpS n=1 Tax=Brachybacterium paraconglomeratum TaxID=173362 RepID=UPI0031E827AD